MAVYGENADQQLSIFTYLQFFPFMFPDLMFPFIFPGMGQIIFLCRQKAVWIALHLTVSFAQGTSGSVQMSFHLR